ncbi:MaoC like domain-containing protein [Blyttiomyces helicus]|uniref:MaoC like domain-containing protein n=1 Tax=Blyttiomyces helicus TaxID=388810 RepID=A0A4P9VYQ6_9FUNG|nr:MaoC like domain-containing protein [Blyttiomyces helicus]|eukprot:RKO84929.1 MaoC like domain-containing protein [Blyttiomyces helicus]
MANDYHSSPTQTLTQEDVVHFISLCLTPGRKPVPFIPVLDDKFDFWFKKDSLWQSEDIDAVVDQDPGRVAILQGPIAVRHSKLVDQPVKQILGDIYHAHIDAIKEAYYGGSDLAIPVVEYLGARAEQLPAGSLGGIVKTELLEGSVMYEVSREGDQLPDGATFLEYIAGADHTWLRALLTSSAVVQGKHLTPNYVQNVLRPRPGQTIIVKYDARRRPQVLTVHHNRPSTPTAASRHPAVTVTAEGDRISVVIFEKRGSKYLPLEFLFKYVPWQGHNPIHEVMEGRNKRIKDFYASLWSVVPSADASGIFRSNFTVEDEVVRDFTQVIGNTAELYLTGAAPMDFAIVAGWQAIVTALLEIDGDLLRLVHLSNRFQILNTGEIIRAGDKIETEAVVNSVLISDAGKAVEVRATLRKSGLPVLEVLSSFLYRGKFTDYESTFKNAVEKPVEINIASPKDVAVLMSKPWMKWSPDVEPLSPGSTLVFRLETHARFKAATVYSRIRTLGTVELKTTRETVVVGKVEYDAVDAHGNLVLSYLNRFGKPIEQPVAFASGGYSILPSSATFPAEVTVPTSNEAYAQCSGDLNPIHTNPYFADLAGLPGTITHGMWTSASTRKFVEIFAANNQPSRVKEFDVKFVDMVLPGCQLETKLSHVGMANGKKLIKVETFIKETGAKVLEGSAEVEQPSTACVFTGQGSQEVGMGMDLYQQSPVARAVWDRADAHMLATYGVSILEIVRQNPKTLTVHFGGRGAAIRAHYMSMTYDVIDANGKLVSKLLFPEVTEETQSHTFSHPGGLLSATQFTQPALTLMEIASFSDMRESGLVQEGCAFAGHR